MTIEIEVKNNVEAERIRVALDDPEMRAFVNIVGALMPLPKRAQNRILNFVEDKVRESIRLGDDR